MTSRIYTIDLTKSAKRGLNKDTLRKKIDYVKERILSAGRDKKGWTVESSRIVDIFDLTDLSNVNTRRYESKLTIKCVPRITRTPQAYDNEFTNIVMIVRSAIRSHGWEIDKIDGNDPPPIVEYDSIHLDIEPTNYVNVRIAETWQESFAHIYERDAHINIIHDAIDIAIESDWKHRFHVLLYGPPGCAKSDLCMSIKNMVGTESVLEFDATATTSAGAIANLRERAKEGMPRILLVEEIEKADENSLRWLLGLLDLRGNVRKLTYRNHTQYDAKMLCIATVNDNALFKRMMSGALASRFAHKLYCSLPDRALLGKILEREVSSIDGDEAWIKPTLDYLERHNITDPRNAIAICLTGRDRLLTGEFQAQMDKTMEPTHVIDIPRKIA